MDRSPDTRRAFPVRSAIVAAGALPLCVALVVLHGKHWFPQLDWAWTEIRIRDVASSHPPLIGLAGRIGQFGPNGGSHPGPISFYALWPVWELFGAKPFGMYAGTVAIDLVAIGLAVWIAGRRGGIALVAGVGLAVVVLERAYGAFLLTQPWNPYLPVLWWVVYLLAIWSLLSDDIALLPVAVFAGTFCMQTHVSYVGLVGGLGAFALVVVLWRNWRTQPGFDRSQLWRYGLMSVALFAVLWAPPVLEQIAHTPGNLTTLREFFSHARASASSNAEGPAIGLHQGVNVLLGELNPFRLLGKVIVHNGVRLKAGGNRLPGLLLVVAWGGSAFVAYRRKLQPIVRLDIVLGLALLLGVVSSARIYGYVWFYLLLWAWGLAVMLTLALVWTIVEVVAPLVDDERRASVARDGKRLLAGLIAVATVVFAVQAADVDVITPRLNDQLGALLPPTVQELQRVQAAGNHQTILVSFTPDPVNLGAEGFGLLNELLRRGFDANASVFWRPAATRYHVVDDARPDLLQVHLAVGSDIARWRADGRFREIAFNDPRSPAEKERFDALRAQAMAELHAQGQDELAGQIDTNAFAVSVNSAVPDATQLLIFKMLALGEPEAVFVGPSGQPPETK